MGFGAAALEKLKLGRYGGEGSVFVVILDGLSWLGLRWLRIAYAAWQILCFQFLGKI